MSTTDHSSEEDGTDRTTVSVSTDTRNQLFELKNPSDSYDDVIRRELSLDSE